MEITKNTIIGDILEEGKKNKNQFLNIDKLKLGNNLFVECNEEDLSYWSSTRCNGCRESLRRDVERYICLDCKRGIKLESGYIDFCSKCIDIMCKNKKEMENLKKLKILEKY